MTPDVDRYLTLAREVAAECEAIVAGLDPAAGGDGWDVEHELVMLSKARKLEAIVTRFAEDNDPAIGEEVVALAEEMRAFRRMTIENRRAWRRERGLDRASP